jgi:hypothetical protein
VPITIELPDLDSQTEFNLARWAEVLADPTLARLPHRIETDQHGRPRRIWVFRMVLRYSRKAYSEAVTRQDVETFLRCLENGLRE